MVVLRVDDLDAPPEARTLAEALGALGPDYDIQITLRESAWLPHAVEHIKVFIHSQFAQTTTTLLIGRIVDRLLLWQKERKSKEPVVKIKFTIYGPDNKPLQTIDED